MSKFSRLAAKIKRSGKSASAANAIAAAIGIKKYGKKGMAAKAAAGRAKK
jgi:hypothetical protein